MKIFGSNSSERILRDTPIRVITQEMGCTRKSWKRANRISLGILDLIARKDMKSRGKKLDKIDSRFKHRVVFSYRDGAR